MSSSKTTSDPLTFFDLSSRSAKPPNKMLKCSRCSDGVGISYCSKDCQKIDWPKHKPPCDIYVFNVNLADRRALASQNRSRADRIAYRYLPTHLKSRLELAAGSIYGLADPTSTLSDTHIFVVDYDVNPRLQHDHQQVDFTSAVLWNKEEWIAKEMKWRNPSGDSELEAVFRAALSSDYLDPKERQSMNENTQFKFVTIALQLTISDRDAPRETFLYPMPAKIQYRPSDDSPRLFQFDNIDSLLNDAKIPRGLLAVRPHPVQLFQALYCQPEISKLWNVHSATWPILISCLYFPSFPLSSLCQLGIDHPDPSY
jgi:hypothetical protein